MNVKEHFKKRYCERVLKLDEKDIPHYLVQNQQRIVEECLRLYEQSKLIWKGVLNDNVVSNYYIDDTWIIVTDKNNTALITIYEVDFGFPKKTNQKVAKDLIFEITKLNEKYDKEIKKANEFIDAKKLEIENATKEIICLEEKIKLLKQKIYISNEEIKQLNAEPMLIQKEIDKYGVQLCNSLALKLDLLAINTKK